MLVYEAIAFERMALNGVKFEVKEKKGNIKGVHEKTISKEII